MSPRQHRFRKILSPPSVKGFKPYGPEVDTTRLSVVTMLYEEYEALRLCDFDMFTHERASDAMMVSRPTFTRIYASARQKMAKALVEGAHLVIEGGKVFFDTNWYQCNTCKCFFNNLLPEERLLACALCGSNDIAICSSDFNESAETDSCNDYCYCAECGYEHPHQYGSPCSIQKCPKCNKLMKRKERFESRLKQRPNFPNR